MLRAYLESVRVLALDPTSNLVAAAIGVSIAVIFLVIIVLILLFFALSPQSSRHKTARRRGAPRARTVATRRTPEEVAREKARRRASRRVWWTTVLGGLAAAWIALFAGTSANLYCANTCHPMVGPADSWKGSAHREVRCVRCHEGYPATSLVTGTISRVRSLYYSLAEVPGAGTLLPPERCLSCHSSILRETIVSDRAIAMSHSEPVRGGAACTDCHGSQGHETEALVASMNACLPCHDGVTAAAECELCHPKGVEAALEQAPEQVGVPVRLPDRPGCGGCHSQASCDACHGIRMPHPADFDKAQKHARLAAFDAKERLCYRCHTPADCYECHIEFDAHVKGWRTGHSAYKRSDGNGYCLWCHETADFCSICH